MAELPAVWTLLPKDNDVSQPIDDGEPDRQSFLGFLRVSTLLEFFGPRDLHASGVRRAGGYLPTCGNGRTVRPRPACVYARRHATKS